MKTIIKLTILSLIMHSCTNRTNIEYPETRKDTIVDNYWGTTVPDPYRWLEDDRSAETEAWVIAQNQVTYSYLEQIPFRNKLKERFTELMNYPKYGSPKKVNNKSFNSLASWKFMKHHRYILGILILSKLTNYKNTT